MVRFASWLNPSPWANSCSNTADEIRLRAVVVVESEVEIEVGAEAGGDVVVGRIKIDSREFICQSDVVPGVRQQRAGEVSRDADRTRATEHARSKRDELCANANRHVAVEPRRPDGGRMFES